MSILRRSRVVVVSQSNRICDITHTRLLKHQDFNTKLANCRFCACMHGTVNMGNKTNMTLSHRQKFFGEIILTLIWSRSVRKTKTN